MGFISRYISAKNPTEEGPFIAQTLFILLAPIIYSASIYALLEKLLQYIGAEKCLPIRASLITKLYVGGDIFTFLVQAAGASMLVGATSVSKLNTGKSVVLIGLAVQILFFFSFVFLIIRAHVVTHKNEILPGQGNWKLQFKVLETGSILILIRSIYRVIDFADGPNSTVGTHEAFAYILDSLMMLFLQLLYNIWYPGKILKPQENTNSSRNQNNAEHYGIPMQDINRNNTQATPQDNQAPRQQGAY